MFFSAFVRCEEKKTLMKVKSFDLKKDFIIERLRKIFIKEKFAPITLKQQNEIYQSKSSEDLFKKIALISKNVTTNSNKTKEELRDIFIPFGLFCNEILEANEYKEFRKIEQKKFPNRLPFDDHPEFTKEGQKKGRNLATDVTLKTCPLKRSFAMDCFRKYFDLNHDDIVQRNEIEYAKSQFPHKALLHILNILVFFGIRDEPTDLIMKKCDLNRDGQITLDEFNNKQTDCLDSCRSLRDLDKYFCAPAAKKAAGQRHKESRNEIHKIMNKY